MNVTWNTCVNWMRGPWKLPAGWTLEYYFLPSSYWYIDIHRVHEFWKAHNEDKHPVDFWHLEKKEQDQWRDKLVEAKRRRFNPARKHFECCWQRFTLRDINGKELILQMDSKGHVAQIQRVKDHQAILDEIQNYLEVGGLFNPEMMEHDKVRDLIIKCREALDKYQHECIVA